MTPDRTKPRPRARKRGSPSPQVLRAVLRLRDMILAGDLRAGQRVAELKLVGSVGVSRTPLRLAWRGSAMGHFPT